MKIIKTSAVSCKHCGARLASEPAAASATAKTGSSNKSSLSVLALILGLLALAGILSDDEPEAVAVSGAATPVDAEQSDGSASPTSQILWIAKSMEGVKARLKDPDSADFRNAHFYSGSGKAVVCGEVNAKNGFGGFTGFERFVASGTDVVVLASDMASANEMAKAWDELCIRGPGDTE